MALIDFEHFKRGLYLDDVMSFLKSQGRGAIDGDSYECLVTTSEKTVKIQKYENGKFIDVHSDAINYLPYADDAHLYTKLGGATDVMSGVFSGCVMAKYCKAVGSKEKGALTKSPASRDLKAGDGDFNNTEPVFENDYRFGHIFVPPGANGGGKVDAFFKQNKRSRFEVCFKPMMGDLATLAELKSSLRIADGLEFIGSSGLNSKVDGAMGIITAANAKYRFFVVGVRLKSDPKATKFLIVSDCEQVDNTYRHG